MATSSLGTLSIDVLANIAGMVSDLGKAQAENAKAAREFQRQWQESIDGVKESFKGLAELAGIAISAEAFKEFIGGALEASEQVERLSQSIGLSTQTLQTLGYAAGLSGSNMDTMAQSTARLEKSAVEAASGNQKLASVFAALGVSVTDANGNLKSSEELFKEVTKALASFANDAEKTTAVMLLMGRGAAENIPLINKLGKEWQGMAQAAKDAGVVLSEADTKALAETQERFNQLGQEIKGVANQLAIALRPALEEAADAAERLLKSQELKDTLHAIGDGAKFAVEHLSEIKQIAELLIELKLAEWFVAAAGGLISFAREAANAETSIVSLKGAIGTLQAAIVGFKAGSYLRDNFTEARVAGDALTESVLIGGEKIKNYSEKVGAFVSSMFSHPTADQWFQTLRNIDSETNKNILSIRNEMDAVTDLDRGWTKTAAAGADFSDVIGKSSWHAEDAADKHLHLAAALNKTSVAVQNALASWQAWMGQLEGIGDNSEIAKSTNEYIKIIDEALKHYNEYIQKGGDVATANEMLAKSFDDADAAAMRMDDARSQKLQDALDSITRKYQEQIDSLHGVTQEQEIEKQYLQDLTTYQAAWNKVMGDGVPITDEMKQHIHDMAAEHVVLMDSLKQSQELLKSWANMAEQDFGQAFQAINKDIIEGGNVMKDLTNLAKQVVEQIIFEFEKLAVINPILNAIFGGNRPGLDSAGGLLGQLFGGGGGGGIANMFGGGGFGGSPTITSSIINDIGQSNLGGLLGEGNTVVGAANNAWNWLSGGGAAFDSTSGMYLMQSSDALGLVPDYAGLGGAGGAFSGEGALSGLGGEAGTYGGEISSAGAGFSWMGAAGGALAAYNEFQAAGGGAAGLAGAAAYGVGTYFAGAAASAALSGGIAEGMAAIPVVGWIALAAMAINMVSGGKLFGTAAKPIGGEFTETIGAGGAALAEVMHEKGQRALFGGSYYKDKNIPVDPATAKAAQDFYDALVKGRDAFAQQFNVTMGDIVGGTFVQHFDKKGKPTTTDDTVLGITYHEDQQHFAERIQADNFLAVLDKMGIGASTFTAGLQQDADKLMAAVQDMAGATQMAQADIKNGMSLLQNDTSIADVMNEVIKLDGANEKLADAYKRLSAESAAFMADMAEAQLQTGKTAQQVLEFADAEAQAAGGAQNLAKLIDQFNKDFYTTAQLQQKSIDDLTTRVGKEGAAIGENPAESLAKFFADYQAALPTLTADQIVAWKQFGVDLVSLNQAMQQVATSAAQAAANYQGFIAQFDTTRTILSPFEQSMVSLGASIGANIDKAEALAKAAGMSGASMEDLGKIITGSITAGVAAVQKLESEAAQLAAGLFGTSDQQLQTQISALQARIAAETKGGGYDFADEAQVAKLNAQLAQQQAQQQALQQLGQATALLGDLGQIGAITGGSLSDLAKQFNIPLDKLAKMLGLDDIGLKGAFAHQEELAKAALDTAGNTKEMTELLADINASINGKAQPFDPSQLINSTLPGTPGGVHGYAPPPGKGTPQPADIYLQNPAGTRGGVPGKQEVYSTQTDKTNALLTELVSVLRVATRDHALPVNRNTRLGTVYTP